MRDFTKLRAFNLAHEVVLLVYKEHENISSRGIKWAKSSAATLWSFCSIEHRRRMWWQWPSGLPGILWYSLWLAKRFTVSVNLSNRLEFFVDHDMKVLQLKIIEAEKVSNGLIRSLCKGWPPLVFSLGTWVVTNLHSKILDSLLSFTQQKSKPNYVHHCLKGHDFRYFRPTSSSLS